MTLRLLSKIGVFALALTIGAMQLAACALPGTAMTTAERECCKKMAERCGGAGMAKSHSCCHVSGAPSNLNALKTSAVQSADFSLMALYGLPVSSQPTATPIVAPVPLQVSDVHGPPGLDSLSTTVLRI